MELSPYVEGLRRELGSLTRFASDDVVRLAERLAEALDSSVRLTLLDVLSAAAAEITTRLDDVVIDVRLNAGEPEFVVTAVPAQQSADEAPGAAADGLSVNSWLAHAAIRALENAGPVRGPRSRSGVGQRITGYARS